MLLISKLHKPAVQPFNILLFRMIVYSIYHLHYTLLHNTDSLSSVALLMLVKPDAETTYNYGDHVYRRDMNPPQGPFVVNGHPPYKSGPADASTKIATRIIPLLNPNTDETFEAFSFDLINAEDY